MADSLDEPSPEALAQRDAEQLLAAMQGDRIAFATLVERHQGFVYGYLRVRVLQAADAEDLTQEVFLRCYQTRERFETSHAVRPWLLGIARNVLREQLRRCKNRRKEVAWTSLCLELDEAAPVETVTTEATPVVEHLPGCLDSLGTSARQAIEMRYENRLRLSEIGQRLRRSEGAAKLLMFRARQALRSCLDRKCRGDAP